MYGKIYTTLADVGPKISLKFEPKYSHINSNGQYPSICMNNKGWVVQVYHKETIINLRLRYKIGFMHESQIIWANKYTSYDKGFFPRLAINNSGIVVAVFSAQLSSQMFYRLGKLWYDQDSDSQDDPESPSYSIPDQDTVDGANIDWLGEKQLIADGHNPAVTINNNNTVIVVYEKGRIRARTRYRIGDVKGKEIEWRSKPDSDARLIESGSSKTASISLNDNGQVAVAYLNTIERDVHFLAGQISSNNTSTITLGEEKYTPPGHINFQPVVSLNNHGHVAAVYHALRGRLYLKHNYGLMQPDVITGQTRIEWSLATPMNFARDGYYSSIAINDSRKVVTAYKSLTLRLKKSLRNKIGEISTD